MPTKNFEKYLYDLSKPYYKKILQSDFIQGIISGNLAKEKFCFYLSQDSLYLSKEVDFFSSLSQKANSQEEKFSKEVIMQELKKIIYPKVGEDIITLKMVQYVGFDNDIVTIDLNIPKFDTYRENIKEEIEEKLEKYTQIKELHINL